MFSCILHSNILHATLYYTQEVSEISKLAFMLVNMGKYGRHWQNKPYTFQVLAALAALVAR